MKISEVITKLAQYHMAGGFFNPNHTRDHVLYGDPEQECTGIVTTCWASIDVIKATAKLGYNMIICHEALFWNHGDQTDWLQDNQTYLEKKALLDQYHITIWRDHDHIHSGIPIGNGKYADGIMYGLAAEMGWVPYLTDITNPLNDPDLAKNPAPIVLTMKVPTTTASKFGKDMVEKLHLNGAKLLGSPDTKVENVEVILHVVGDAKGYITHADKSNVDLMITLELIDFTLAQYVRDASQAGKNKALLTVGHFNLEEPGMKYMQTYLGDALGQKVPSKFIKSGDMYTYL